MSYWGSNPVLAHAKHVPSLLYSLFSGLGNVLFFFLVFGPYLAVVKAYSSSMLRIIPVADLGYCVGCQDSILGQLLSKFLQS